MQINQLSRRNKNKRSQQVGRGGRRGKTSGRGTKGQKARSGHKMRPEIRDIIKKLPRLRGRGKNSLKSIQKSVFVLNLGDLERTYVSGEIVSKETLRQKGLIQRDVVALSVVKILGGGSLTKSLTVSGCKISGKAKELVEKAGGKVS